jgi:hypothetical protein
MMQRRKFIRTAGLGIASSLVPGNVLATSLAPLYTGNVDPGDQFSLDKISMALGEYQFPYASSFDSRSYTLNYTLHNFYQHFVKEVGSFRMERKGSGHPVFRVTMERDAAGDVITELRDTYTPVFDGSFIVKAEVKTAANELATPLEWKAESRISREGADTAYGNTLHRWKGSYTDGSILYESGSGMLKKGPVRRELAWKWGLIHTVQEMARKNISRLEFSTLDELDMVYESQEAILRKKQKVECGNGMVEFTVIDVLGDGIVPTVYWVDDHFRTCFIITGVEAYLIAK